MRWKATEKITPPMPTRGDMRTARKFAFLPIKTAGVGSSQGYQPPKWVWFEWVYRTELYVNMDSFGMHWLPLNRWIPEKLIFEELK